MFDEPYSSNAAKVIILGNYFLLFKQLLLLLFLLRHWNMMDRCVINFISIIIIISRLIFPLIVFVKNDILIIIIFLISFQLLLLSHSILSAKDFLKYKYI